VVHSNSSIAWLAAAAIAAISVVLAGSSLAQSPEEGIVSIGGSVTEIIYELGEQDRLLARDSTSTFPSEVTDLPNVGYMRALSPEGVLSIGGSMIISEEGAGPPETIAVLRAADIPFVEVPSAYTHEDILAKILAVGAALDVEPEAEALAARVHAELSAAEDLAAQRAGDQPLRVMFILSVRDGRIMAGGRDTSAHGIIEMAGGENAFSDFHGYRLVSDEAVVAANPDVILMMNRGGDHGADDATLFAMPALRTSQAAADNAVIRLDGLLMLGFGPRTAEAVTLLSDELYGG